MSLNYSHLPSLVENNWFFRKLFLLRKLFLTRKKFTYYSQFAEDISISRLFSEEYKGFYVDVGCFHPVKYNNTYSLHRRGWRGINIDIDSIKIEGFKICRPQDTNICCAVSEHAGTVTYWSSGFYSLTSTVDEAYVQGKKGYVQKSVETDTLENIIDRTKYKNHVIDLLSVDTEGHDLSVIKSLNVNRYQPKIIMVETHLHSLEDVMKDDLYTYVTNQGYELINWVGLSLIFKRLTRAST